MRRDNNVETQTVWVKIIEIKERSLKISNDDGQVTHIPLSVLELGSIKVGDNVPLDIPVWMLRERGWACM